MKIGIVGIGHVGGTMAQLFPKAVLYDKYKNIGSQEEINDCDISFICVPTPSTKDGYCDTSIVSEVLSWLDTPIIVIRSTVPVGFTNAMNTILGKHIVFQPEYYGETVAHPFADPHNRNWITLGGNPYDCSKVADVYRTVFTSELIINIVSADTAELAKYMENAFYATKVTFCNQFYELAKNLGVNYDQLRETWLLDPRISRDHTFIYPDNRGYGGSCLPKDIAAITVIGEDNLVNVDFLKAVQTSNEYFRSKNK